MAIDYTNLPALRKRINTIINEYPHVKVYSPLGNSVLLTNVEGGDLLCWIKLDTDSVSIEPRIRYERADGVLDVKDLPREYHHIRVNAYHAIKKLWFEKFNT